MKPTTQRWSRVGLCLAAVLACMFINAAAGDQGFTTTTVRGTVYLANGQPGSGSLQLSWPAFTTASNQAVAAGRTNVSIGADGYVMVNLAPNQGSTPAGLYYTAIYHLSDGTTSTEYWVVPAAAQASLSEVRAQVMPAAQAVHAVSQSYVDETIAELTQKLLTPSGGTLSGPLILSGDPTEPAQAATKRYVDKEFSMAVPLSGGVMSGPLTGVRLGAAYQVDQFPGVDFGSRLQACLDQLDAVYGGTCDARNFTATQSMGSPVVITTANATVDLPCATIAAANQIQVTAGTRNVTLHGCALRGGSNLSGSQGGTVFLYSGSGPMIQIGDPTYNSDTLGFHLDNIVINTTQSTNAAAQGLAAYRTQEMDLEGLYFLGNSNQTGMTLDGTGNYTGGTFQDLEFGGFGAAVDAIGHQTTNPAPTDWLNASTFVRLHINCPTSGGSPVAGTYGINLLAGDGNTFTGGDVEGCATALHLGPNAQNNTIVGLRNENSINQIVADAGSSYNNWITGGTMFNGKLTDNGTRNSFLDTFHRSFNSLNGDWYGSQQDATVTNHFRVGTGAGNERGLLNRYQTDDGYRWTTGFSDATAGEQFYQLLDELNNVYRLSIGQYNHGQSSTNNQTVINAAGTGAVVLNGSANAGTGGVIFGAGGSAGATVATINNAGNAQFNGSLQVGGPSTFIGSTTVRNQADGEIDSFLWAGATANQKESYIYKDYTGASQWYMVKDASNNWALNSAIGGLDSFKAYQSSNSGDTYINASNGTGHIRFNYETGSGAETDIYSGSSAALVAAFLGSTAIKFPGLAAGSGHNCLQIDNSGYISNTGSACATAGSLNGTVNSGSAGQVAYYSGNGTVLAGTSSVAVSAGGTGATTALQALENLGAHPFMPGIASDGASGVTVSGNVSAGGTESGSVNGVYDLKAKFGMPGLGSGATMTCTATAGSATLTNCSGGDFVAGAQVYISAAGLAPTLSTPAAPATSCGSDGGASCTGTTTYGYKIVSLQGWPSGAFTAASSAGTVTQAAQTKAISQGGSGTDVYTNVSWTAVANTTGYIIYKSIGGGAYNFYAVIANNLTSFKDFGNVASPNFTCADWGVPCTAPSTATPTAVRGSITAVNGSSYTLGTLSGGQPFFVMAGGLSSSTIPSTPSINGTVTVEHDDSPAFIAASVFFAAGHSGQLHIPAGTYHVHNGTTHTSSALHSYAPFLVAGWNNVTIQGDGAATTKIIQSGDGAGGEFIAGVCGDTTGLCSYRLANYSGGSIPGYNLVDPVPAGAKYVTLSTASEASNFPAGTYVTIYDNATTYPGNTYGELNLVISSDTTSGIVQLKYPTTKMYSATLSAPWNEEPSAQAQPMMSVATTEATNLAFRDFDFKGPVYFFNQNTMDWVTIENMEITTEGITNSGSSRHLHFNNNKIVDGSVWGFPVGAAADADIYVTDNTYTSGNWMGPQMCTENTTNESIVGNTYIFNGPRDWPGAASNILGAGFGGGTCWNWSVLHNRMFAFNTNSGAFVGDPGATSGTVTGNDFFIDANSSVGHIANTNGANTNPWLKVFANNWEDANPPTNNGPSIKGQGDFLGSLSSITLNAQSNVVVLYSMYGAATIYNINMAGNINTVNFGGASTRVPGYYFAVNFIQPSAGGPYNIPSDCTGASWGVAIDCPGSIPPQVRTTANSQTLAWFYDDGTTVHYLGSNNNGTGALADWSNAGASTGFVATCKTVSGGNCTSWGPAAAGGSSGVNTVAKIDRSGQAGNIGNTIAYTIPSGGAGYYRVSCYETVTTAATTSSTLPLCGTFWTDEDTGGSIRSNLGNGLITLGTTSTQNTVGSINFNGGGNSVTFKAAQGTSIYYETGTFGGYASAGATAMQFGLHFVVEYLGP